MPLRIAFDLDGVLADMESALVREAEVVFGEAVTRRLRERAAEVDEAIAATNGETPAGSEAERQVDTGADPIDVALKLNMTARQESRLWRHVASVENFWESLHELEPGVIARIAAVAADRRWEIIFLTRRPQTAGSTAQVQSQRWLASKGFPLPSVYVVQGSRGRIAAALGLDIVVDDRPENCLDVVADSKARAILVCRDGEKYAPAAARRLGIGVVKSVSMCLDILTEVDTPAPQEHPGMVDRIKRLLGLKAPAGA